MEFALKHIFARDIMRALERFADYLRTIDRAGGSDYISVMLQYIFERGELKDRKALISLINEQISPEVGGKVMTLAELCREEGKMEGKAEGKAEGFQLVAKRLLSEGLDPGFIARVTNLPLDTIVAMQG